MHLEDRTNGRLTIDDFFANAQAVIAQANQQPALKGGVFTQFTRFGKRCVAIAMPLMILLNK